MGPPRADDVTRDRDRIGARHGDRVARGRVDRRPEVSGRDRGRGVRVRRIEVQDAQLEPGQREGAVRDHEPPRSRTRDDDAAGEGSAVERACAPDRARTAIGGPGAAASADGIRWAVFAAIGLAAMGIGGVGRGDVGLRVVGRCVGGRVVARAGVRDRGGGVDVGRHIAGADLAVIDVAHRSGERGRVRPATVRLGSDRRSPATRRRPESRGRGRRGRAASVGSAFGQTSDDLPVPTRARARGRRTHARVRARARPHARS